jgi:hyaluronan synthase
MVVNEDRHLTTNLLLGGWKVMFASDVLTATDTPTTMSRWLKQQVRWARATHIEALLHPKVYATSHPLLFYSMAKREFGPAIGAIAITWYFFTSQQLVVFSARDLLLRVVLGFCYNLLRNPDRITLQGLLWVVPSILFYYIPLPAVHLWSLVTMSADGWGTSMRANGERARKESLRQAWFDTGFFVVWMGMLGGVAAKVLGTYYCMVWHERMAATVLSVAMGSFGAWLVTIGAS